MDFGCKYEGYCSDMTRTVVLGKANDKQKEIYNVVLEAQLAGLAAVKAGKTGKEVDKVARDIITKAGYGEYFRTQPRTQRRVCSSTKNQVCTVR